MTTTQSLGQIVTFYSFKGGVGRTMALANVAFLAAENGFKVLVMDWDLEAPGLGCYFRALQDTPAAKRLKAAPGVLDFLWEWRTAVNAAESEAEQEALLNRFQQGIPFQACVQPLLATEGKVLHFIGAGGANIPTPQPVSYEQALSDFSWASFFEKEAGGHVIANLRQWAKREYDMVLVDSRTGLADVAGICTMQIPDAVALCFILNRQNVEGIAKVAAAIRANRQDNLAIHAVPMRVARQDTAEESDARAWSMQKLKQAGGFSSEALQHDFRELSVAAAENIPFYETLAPFTAKNLSYDPLTLNYLGLANGLFGKPFVMPELNPEWLKLVQRRLQPNHATIDYIEKLVLGVPDRAIVELPRLLESVIETARYDSEDLYEDYVAALINGLQVWWFLVSPNEAIDIQNKVLKLLRSLAADQPSKWINLLISTFEWYMETLSTYLKLEEQLALFKELDDWLVQLPITTQNRLKRILYKRKLARVYLDKNEIEVAEQTVAELQRLIKEVEHESIYLVFEQGGALSVVEARLDICILIGDICLFKGNFGQSVNWYQHGVEFLVSLEQRERDKLSELEFGLHSRLAQTQPAFLAKRVAAEHAVQAIKCGSGRIFALSKFNNLAQVVLSVPEYPQLALDFCELSLDVKNGSRIPDFYGRRLQKPIEFLTMMLAFARIIVQTNDSRSPAVLLMIVEASILVVQNSMRGQPKLSQDRRDQLSALIDEILLVLENSGLPLEHLSALRELMHYFP